MRKALYFVGLFFLIYSCSLNKQPIFVKIDNLKVISYAADTVKIKAVAFFENPNDVGGKISTENLKILVNDIEVAQLFSEDFKIPAKNNFSIPLRANIPTKNLLITNKNNVLGSLLSSLITKKIIIRIKGNLVYVIFGLKTAFLVDKTEALKINF
jgi:hypothetical protein